MIMRKATYAYTLRVQRQKDAEKELEQQRRESARSLGISYESYMARFIKLQAGY